jgi:pseudouridylate synthase
VLIACPPPLADVDESRIQQAIEQATGEVAKRGVHGGAVTPFLLQRISELTDGASLRANTALLRNNASIAAEIAVADAALGEN